MVCRYVWGKVDKAEREEGEEDRKVGMGGRDERSESKGNLGESKTNGRS